MKTTEKTFISKICIYAKRKNWSLVGALILSILALVLGVVCNVVKCIGGKDISLAIRLYLVFVVGLVVMYIVITHYEKVRQELINEVGTKSLGEFFDFLCDETKKDYVYYEVKDIFMYGLWRLKDKNAYMKMVSEKDEHIFSYDEIIDNNITNKEILAASMFRCLTFKRDGLVYRNQMIFQNQKKFQNVLDEYAKVYGNKNNHRNEYINICNRIEETYREDKINAKKEGKGLTKEIGKWEQFVVFCNNPKLVMLLRKIFVVIAIASMLLLFCVQYEIIPEKYENQISFYVTCVFNMITIVLLLVDIAKKDEKEVLQL